MTCLRAGLVLTRLRAGLVLTCLRARLVFTCLRAGLVSEAGHVSSSRAGNVLGRKCLAACSVQKFRAGNVSRPVIVRGRDSLGAV